mgnify:CR=1 FL=1
MNVKEEIKRAIKHGIYMGEFSKDEERKFIGELFSFLISKNNFCLFKDNDRTIVVSSIEEDLAEVFIHAGTLKIVPQASEGYFKIFMDVLEFIANKHKEEMKQLSSPEDEETEEDDSTEDDGEWWL